MEMNKDMEEALQRFVSHMRFKLHINRNKTPMVPSLVHLLKGEIHEAMEAVENGNHQEILDETADIANMAFLIFLRSYLIPKPELNNIRREENWGHIKQ